MLNENAEIFSPNAIYFQKNDRAMAKNAIVHQLWMDILVLAFKLITTIPGFSFCSEHGDYDSKNPGVTMKKVVIELEYINTFQMEGGSLIFHLFELKY